MSIFSRLIVHDVALSQQLPRPFLPPSTDAQSLLSRLSLLAGLALLLLSSLPFPFPSTGGVELLRLLRGGGDLLSEESDRARRAGRFLVLVRERDEEEDDDESESESESESEPDDEPVDDEPDELEEEEDLWRRMRGRVSRLSRGLNTTRRHRPS